MASPSLGNVTFPSFRSSLNDIIQALDTVNAGTTAPTDYEAYSLWLDTNSPVTLKVRNSSNTAWVSLLTMTGTDASGAGWFVDEDTMTSDSATKVPSQQSVKAYVDSEIAGIDTTSLTLETVADMTAQSSVSFTGIPSGTNRITIMFDQVAKSGITGTRDYWVRIGDSGGVETSGYTSRYAKITAGSEQSSSSGFLFFRTFDFISVSGSLILTRVTSNDWVIQGVLNDTQNPEVIAVAGRKTLSAELDRVQIAISTGSFDSGNVNISYE